MEFSQFRNLYVKSNISTINSWSKCMRYTIDVKDLTVKSMVAMSLSSLLFLLLHVAKLGSSQLAVEVSASKRQNLRVGHEDIVRLVGYKALVVSGVV